MATACGGCGVTSDRRVDVMSLLASPTGHLVNLSPGAPGGEAAPPPATPVYAAIEVTGRSTASTGVPLALVAKSVGAGGVAIDRFEWTLPDGRTLSGEEVSVSFAEAGIHAVNVKAMSGSDVAPSRLTSTRPATNSDSTACGCCGPTPS